MNKMISALSMFIIMALCLAGQADAIQPEPSVKAQPQTEGPGIRLVWESPADVQPTDIHGYNVYRSEEIMGHYRKINKQPVKEPFYEDRGLVKGKDYFYRVATILNGGKESKPTMPVGLTAGSGSESQAYTLPVIRSFSSDALGTIKYSGDEAVFILDGDAGLKASMDIAGVASGLQMEEVQPGTYRFIYKVRPGTKVRNTYAKATLTDVRGGKSVKSTPESISFHGVGKPALTGFYAGIIESDRVGLNWPRQEVTEGYFSLYRDTSRIVGMEGIAPLSGRISGSAAAHIDFEVVPGTTYYYVLARNDGEGVITAFTENLEVHVPVKTPSGIESVDEDSGGKVLKAGVKLSVAVRTKPGGKAFFSLGDAVRDMEMAEAEPGLYRGSYTFREGDGSFKSRVSVSFKDAGGAAHFASSATFVTVDAPRGTSTTSSGKKPVIEGIKDDIQTVAGISGRLTAGKTFTVTMNGEPGNKAYFSVGDGIWKVPMKEDSPGLYTGLYTVKPGDNAGTSPDPFRKAYVTGYLESSTGAVSDPFSGAVPVVIDTTCSINVEVSEQNLPADARSQAKVVFTVTDADGQPVRNRRLTVALEPPPRYTGVVGGGGMEQGLNGSQTLLGRLQVDFDDLTDDFGRMAATYTTGFAAKTAVIVARDYATGSVGMNYITTSISSSVNITLLQPLAGVAPVAAPSEPTYQLVVDVVPDPANPVRTYPGFILDAVPNSLTADGVSRANIIATLTKDGAPVSGKKILFAVSGAGGSLTNSSAITDPGGRSQVFYIAGTKAGKAIITATEAATGVSVTTVIVLLADAPAKIYAKAYPDELPADGVSSSRVVVELADVNNNPTDGVSLQFSLRGGTDKGMISGNSAVTDLRGAADFIYTAGVQPGVATVDITAMSEAPTEEEAKASRSRIMAPEVYDNYDMTELVVLKWYKNAGDAVGQGEPLASVGTPLGSMTVYSPASGLLDRITVDQGINVMEGREIGAVK
jgi:hypothetical protein